MAVATDTDGMRQQTANRRFVILDRDTLRLQQGNPIGKQGDIGSRSADID